ncbi:MAG TPA: hypothetical protein VKG21_11175 [Casimicrobiaceae bacterium]|nr:hypothetical protein [Casimicrobiaceae bacterium]
MRKLGIAVLTLGASIVAASATATPSSPPPSQLTSGSPHLTRINKNFMIKPEQALQWAMFKSQVGPTYTGSPGGNKWLNFIETTMQEFGAVDLFIQDLPYSFFTVNDWPDPRTHFYGSGVEVEKLVSNGKPVPVIASYGMTSGSTPANGITAPLIYYDPSHPPTPAAIAGKIIVFQTVPYPGAVAGINPPYSYTNAILPNYTYTDYEFQSPGDWSFPMFTPVPPSVSSSYWYRWVWSQLGGFATTAMKGNAAGMIVVYDLSPAGAFGLIQRSVYSLTGNGGPGTAYQNVPTLCLDRVNGAQVITDAKAGASATLTLNANFLAVQGQYVIGYLPGKYYGTPQDEQILLATHTDAMSLVEEDGSFGMLGIMYYMNHIPQQQRPRTLVFWFDSRHFMPGAESAWSQYDFYLNNPDKLTPIVATMGMEHMGGRSTLETGADGNNYVYSTASPQDGGVITSFLDLNNNNIWLIDTVAKSVQDNSWPRVEASSGTVAPGVNGGFQKQVLSPVNKGRSYTPQIPGIGLAGDWPGAWTQEYSQLSTEAGYPGFDENYFVTQVAGLAQIAGSFMAQDNIKIVLDLGWGQIASGLTCTLKSICTTSPSTGLLPDSGFATPANAPSQRAQLVSEYKTAFQYVEQAQYAKAIDQLQVLEQDISRFILDPNQTLLNILINDQIAKLAAL